MSTNFLSSKITAFSAVFLLIFYSSALYAKEPVYSFGVVPQFDSRKISSIWSPILKRVEDIAGVKFKLTGSPNIPKFEKQFLAGDFDFAYMNPYHLIIANNSQGYTPFLKDTGRKLFGIIVVRKDSPIQSIKELNGKKIAFPAPNALGASLLPRAEFKRVHNMKIIPSYVKSHTSVYLNVLLKQADAGGGVQKTLQQQSPTIKNALKIIHKTATVVPHPISAHPRVSKEVREEIQKAFLILGESEEGKERLAKIPMKRIGKAVLKDYQPLEKLGLSEFYVTQ